MKSRLHRTCALLILISLLVPLASTSAYDGRPKLIVIIVIDQFRGDYAERYHDRFGENGFRLYLDRGTAFTNCNFDYANTRTAPGHATLFTGAYTDGHGIGNNHWWDPERKRLVSAVSDPSTTLVGVELAAQPGMPGPPTVALQGIEGASPHYLRADTLGDELKLATGGHSRVFSISLKARAAILPGGYSADAVYWVERQTGVWITSSYYMSALPDWVRQYNQAKHAEKYWDRSWTDASGKELRNTKRQPGKGFYEIVGSTPLADEYELDFARELVTQEKLGTGPNTDLLAISLSANDILGHQVGPDSPQMQAMVMALDRQLADFTSFLGRQLGLANVWLVLSADHGMAPLPTFASKLRIPAVNFDGSKQLKSHINSALSVRFGPGEYVRDIEWPIAYVAEDAFAKSNLKEGDAERAVAEALLKEPHIQGAYTRSQLEQGQVPNDAMGRKYLHSYTPYGGWYVMAVPSPFAIGWPSGDDHSTPYTYDTRVPLYFYGLAFRPGIYRTHCEPVDLAVTLASLLGINAPTHAVGRVLNEALVSKEAGP